MKHILLTEIAIETYNIDVAKIEKKADENFESGILKTIEWYLEKYNENN